MRIMKTLFRLQATTGRSFRFGLSRRALERMSVMHGATEKVTVKLGSDTDRADDWFG